MVRRFLSVPRVALATVLFLGAAFVVAPAPASAAVDWNAGVRAINAKYASSNFTAILGAPTNDVTFTPVRQGLFRHYERGSIYWAPWIGARAIYGDIHQTWGHDHGWENGFFGFPISDEKAGCENMTSPPAGTRQSIFEGGLICWKPTRELSYFLRTNFRVNTVTGHWGLVPGLGRQLFPRVEVRSGGNLYIRIDTLTCRNMANGQTVTDRNVLFGNSPMFLTSSLRVGAGTEVRCTVTGATTGDPSIYRADTYAPDNTVTQTIS